MKRLVKKIAGTTLALTMAVSGTAFAADIDLTGMSLDELVELRSNITAEIDARSNGGKEIIPAGKYAVGKDIKEGSFKLSAGDDWGIVVAVLSSEDDYAEYYKEEQNNGATDVTPVFEVLLFSNDSTTVSLSDGMVLYISSHELFIEEASASWIPNAN